MKRFITAMIVVSMLLTLTACGGENSSEDDDITIGNAENTVTEKDISESDGEVIVTDREPESLGRFSTDAVISETVLHDSDGSKITATSLTYDAYSVKLNLTFENNTEKDLTFLSGTISYNCNSINGYMVEDGYLNCDVAAGEKTDDTIEFSIESLMIYGINEIADLEVAFNISDNDYNDIYTGPCRIETSAYAAHDYGIDYYRKTITSKAAMSVFDYTADHFSDDILFDKNGVKLVSSGFVTNNQNDTSLFLELENTIGDSVDVEVSDISINGLSVCGSAWDSITLNPGCRGIEILELTSLLDSTYMKTLGIKEVGTVSFALAVVNPLAFEESNPVTIRIDIPENDSIFDPSGEEIYSKDGIRIISKSIIEEKSSYSSYEHVLLLVENNSGKDIWISDEYDSLSVNGNMADYSFYSVSIRNGKIGLVDIELWGDSLEEIQITSASDIKHIEVTIEIAEGWDTIDKPVLSINFN